MSTQVPVEKVVEKVIEKPVDRVVEKVVTVEKPVTVEKVVYVDRQVEVSCCCVRHVSVCMCVLTQIMHHPTLRKR